MKILVLYNRLAGYWMTSMRKFIELYGGEFIVFRNVNSSASPFELQDEKGIRLYDAKKYDKKELLNFCIKENPDIVYVGGWNNEKYLKVAGYFRSKLIPVLCGIDNPWTNSLKQRMGKPILKNILHRHFSHVWIPGDFQNEFVKKMGYRNGQVIRNLYSADLELFLKENDKNKSSKSRKFPHRFIYVGRYLTLKGIEDLWEAFIRLQEEDPNDWELWCLGTGDLYEKRPEHPKIRHVGFVQPAELPNYIRETGVLVLPSHYDHWGVAVHEFAAAGYPLICSDNVGAATKFLAEGKNGFLHKAGEVSSLKEAMKKIINIPDDELVRMGEVSTQKAKAISPEVWSKSLMSVLDQYQVNTLE